MIALILGRFKGYIAGVLAFIALAFGIYAKGLRKGKINERAKADAKDKKRADDIRKRADAVDRVRPDDRRFRD